MIDSKIDNVLQFKRIASKCQHQRFVLDERLQAAECGDCGEKMSLFYVLKFLAKNIKYLEHKKIEAMQMIKIADERTKFKCDHCHKFTRLK